ncbi:MAG: TonB family protein [candidate division Zixibacteria bacterium]|nr:TonB family protein [candidate division Zixibacteria bacterium]MCK4607106.1 TonB family protein [candidate division Zixibacteria bacterium]
MTVFASPFEVGSPSDYDEVIRVSLLAPAEILSPQAEPPEPIAIRTPQPAAEEIPEITVGEPTTADEAVVEEKPQPKPPVHNGQTADRPGGEDEEIHSPITGGGSPFAGATIDNTSFNYPYWFTQAFNKILRNWRNPVAADGAIVCVVYFQVIKSGRVIEVQVKTSSGIGAFDDGCLHAVSRSAPFPPLPRSFGEEIIGITLPFKYEPGY